MIESYFYAFLSILLISFVSLIGVFSLSVKIDKLRKILIYGVSFAAGALLGDVFFHLLPEIVEKDGFGLSLSFSILGGIGLSFVIEKFIRWRHCHIPTSKKHPHPFAIMNLIGDGVHNFIDGIIIGASYLISIPVGIATSLAVFLHEIPQEIGDFGVLLHGGFSRIRALLMNFLLSLTAFLGLFFIFLIENLEVMPMNIFLGLAVGSFLYIAGTDLIPELHKESNFRVSLLQLIFLIFGALIISLLLFLE